MEFQLKQKGKLLGTLRYYESNFPWTNCKFEPTEAFQAVKSLFDEEIELLEKDDIENWEIAYDRINDLSLELINLEDENIIGEFLIHIEGDEAWFRY